VSALRHGVLYVECPECGRNGPGPDMLSDWNGKTYLFACGHRAHLDESKGGATTWLNPPASNTGDRP
jgi:hypothetical protein